MLQQKTIPRAEGESRQFERVELLVPGRLYDPLTGSEVPCQVLSLSPAGAGVSASARYASGCRLILYIDGFGRFEGDHVEHQADEGEACSFGLKFALCRSKRERVTIMLAQFVEGGLTAVTHLRAARRVRTNGMIDMHIGDGAAVTCELIDISLDGVALTTPVRPAIGELVKLGETFGRVVRHHETGIALKFLREAAIG